MHRFQSSDAKPSVITKIESVDNQSGVKSETPELILRDAQRKNSNFIKKKQSKKKFALVELADQNIETDCKTNDEEILPHPADDNSKQVKRHEHFEIAEVCSHLLCHGSLWRRKRKERGVQEKRRILWMLPLLNSLIHHAPSTMWA